MSGIDKVAALAREHDWMVLHHDDDAATFCKWKPGMVRVEVRVLFDRLGRIEAVSLWHNQRQEIHHQPGVRAEAERLLSAPP